MEQLNRWMSVVVVLAVVTAAVLLRPVKPAPDDKWFQHAVLESQKPVVVKFGAEWCGPCRSMDAAFRKLEPRMGHYARFLIIDIDERPDLFAHYQSGSGIPQVMIFDQGSVIASQRGFPGEDRLEAWIRDNI